MSEENKDFTLIRYTDLYHFGIFLCVVGMFIFAFNIGNSLIPYLGIVVFSLGISIQAHYKKKINQHKTKTNIQEN